MGLRWVSGLFTCHVRQVGIRFGMKWGEWVRVAKNQAETGKDTGHRGINFFTRWEKVKYYDYNFSRDRLIYPHEDSNDYDPNSTNQTRLIQLD